MILILKPLKTTRTFIYKRLTVLQKLSTKHPYYYQIQTEINLCKKKHCDFFICTEKDYHIECIFPDKKLWQVIIKECEATFKYVILPELVVFFTNKIDKEIVPLSTSIENCYCNGKEDGELFPCNNIDCLKKLFHLKVKK